MLNISANTAKTDTQIQEDKSTFRFVMFDISTDPPTAFNATASEMAEYVASELVHVDNGPPSNSDTDKNERFAIDMDNNKIYFNSQLTGHVWEEVANNQLVRKREVDSSYGDTGTDLVVILDDETAGFIDSLTIGDSANIFNHNETNNSITNTSRTLKLRTETGTLTIHASVPEGGANAVIATANFQMSVDDGATYTTIATKPSGDITVTSTGVDIAFTVSQQEFTGLTATSIVKFRIDGAPSDVDFTVDADDRPELTLEVEAVKGYRGRLTLNEDGTLTHEDDDEVETSLDLVQMSSDITNLNAANPVPRWSATGDYDEGDYVTYKGITYQALDDVGPSSSTPADDTTNWIALIGDSLGIDHNYDSDVVATVGFKSDGAAGADVSNSADQLGITEAIASDGGINLRGSSGGLEYEFRQLQASVAVTIYGNPGNIIATPQYRIGTGAWQSAGTATTLTIAEGGSSVSGTVALNNNFTTTITETDPAELTRVQLRINLDSASHTVAVTNTNHYTLRGTGRFTTNALSVNADNSVKLGDIEVFEANAKLAQAARPSSYAASSYSGTNITLSTAMSKIDLAGVDYGGDYLKVGTDEDYYEAPVDGIYQFTVNLGIVSSNADTAITVNVWTFISVTSRAITRDIKGGQRHEYTFTLKLDAGDRVYLSAKREGSETVTFDFVRFLGVYLGAA